MFITLFLQIGCFSSQISWLDKITFWISQVQNIETSVSFSKWSHKTAIDISEFLKMSQILTSFLFPDKNIKYLKGESVGLLVKILFKAHKCHIKVSGFKCLALAPDFRQLLMWNTEGKNGSSYLLHGTHVADSNWSEDWNMLFSNPFLSPPLK